LRGLLLREGRGGERQGEDERGGREEKGGDGIGRGGEGRGEEAFLVMQPRRLSALNPPLTMAAWSVRSRHQNCFRRLEKLVLPSIFDTSLLSLMMSNLHSYPTTVLNEKSAQRDANTARAGCSKVWTPPGRPPVANTQTHRQDR